MPSFWEKIRVDGQDMAAYVSIPDGAGPFAAIIVGQHGGGVDRFIRTICDRFAAAGYAAVAPNLYHRIPDETLNANPRPRPRDVLRDPEIIADLDAAVGFLRNRPEVDGQRLGITGFCMGGRVAWLGAACNPHLRASVPYYGGNIMTAWGAGAQPPFAMAAGINCPILFHFGEIDQNPSQEDMRKLDAELTRLGKPHQFYTYPGADHAFMDFTANRYHQEAAQASWPRTLEFFAAHLKN